MFPNLTGGLSSILSIVPTPEKMTFIPFKEKAGIPIPMGPPYVVMFNPETLSEEISYCFNQDQPPGSAGATARFNKRLPPVFQLEFLIDGTGASGDKREVSVEIELFRKILEVNGAEHRPAFLLLVYGTFYAKCVLAKMEITYTMFRKNGTPLRAKAKCTFHGHVSRVFDLLNLNLLSPDLTRKHIIKEGDSLPLLCDAIYESPRFYIEAAKANGLTNFRRLTPGQKLTFPPIEKQ